MARRTPDLPATPAGVPASSDCLNGVLAHQWIREPSDFRLIGSKGLIRQTTCEFPFSRDGATGTRDDTVEAIGGIGGWRGAMGARRCVAMFNEGERGSFNRELAVAPP